ncbi:MAG: acyl-CoA desaturase [Bacteroidota bacterium]|nr:acyl-CoA desaturase [Bacteroidota bacterium]
MVIIIFFISLWYLSLFTQTFFLHRYASHRTFTMSKFWERVFYIFSYLMQGTSYMSPRGYAPMHRMHHAFTDTELDPHSPKYFPNVFAMMWQTHKVYAGIYNGTTQLEPQFLINIPSWPAIDKFGESIYSRLFWISIYVSIFVLYADSPWLYLLLPFVILMGPLHGAIINWFGHKYGSIQFKLNNTSRNLFPIDLLMLGEGYHNDHHHTPSSANFGSRWYEIDPVYLVMRLFHKLRIIKLNNPPA